MFDKYVKDLGFYQSNGDQCLYIYKNDCIKVYILLYVDDIIIAGNNQSKIDFFKLALEKRFKVKDLGE